MADTTTNSGILTSAVTKPVSSFLDEYQRQQLQKKAQGDTSLYGQYVPSAAKSLADASNGVVSPALQAATQSSREALARQAGNERMATSTAVAAQGAIGQGSGFKAVQGTENTIAKQLADSRLNEVQAIGTMQESARNTLLTNANQETQQNTSNQMGIWNNLLQNGTAAQKLQAQAGLQGLTGMAPGANTDQINNAAYQEAVSDPKYKLDQSQAQLALQKSGDETAKYQVDQQYQQFNDLAERSGSYFTSTDTKYRSGFQTNATPGQYVMYDGTPWQFVSKKNKDESGDNSTYGYNDNQMYTYTLKNPVTGEIKTLSDQPKDVGTLDYLFD